MGTCEGGVVRLVRPTLMRPSVLPGRPSLRTAVLRAGTLMNVLPRRIGWSLIVRPTGLRRLLGIVVSGVEFRHFQRVQVTPLYV